MSVQPPDGADLEPVLMSMARVVSRGAIVTPLGLDVLLLATDLKASDAAKESLLKIARILQQGAAAQSSEERMVAGEALALTGLPIGLMGAILAQSVEGRPLKPTGEARSAEPVSAPPVPARSSGYVVDASGHGTHRTLGQALDSAATNDTITLAPGTYEINGGLLQKPLTIAGSGMDGTEIVLRDPFAYGESGFFAMRDVTVRWAAPSDASSMVMVQADELRLERCRFSGAGATGEGSVGILVVGRTQGLISHCIVEDALVGIGVAQHAKLTLEGNTCRKNSLTGIGYQDTGGGIARNNQCTDNGLVGIFLQGRATPELIDNVCNNNQEDGIRARDEAAVLITGNTCSKNGNAGIMFQENASGLVSGCIADGNKVAGISASGRSILHVTDTTCSENGMMGLFWTGSSYGEIKNNLCRDNKESGILVSDDAHPFIQGNTCHGGAVGIGLAGRGEMRLEGNTCTGARQAGIQVIHEREVAVLDNTLGENHGTGVLFGGSSKGVARGNVITANGMGLYIDDSATPLCEDNTCQDNVYSGAVIYSDSRPTLRNNRFLRNAKNGIFVCDNAAPMLDGNSCEQNFEHGIIFGAGTSGTAGGNRCRSNGGWGILVEEGANPTIGENDLIANSSGGLSDSRQQRQSWFRR